MKPGALGLSLIAAVCFIAAFYQPLVCSDFSLEKVPYLETAEAVVDSPCEEMTVALRESIPSLEIARWEYTLDQLLDQLPGTDADEVWEATTHACKISLKKKLQSAAYRLLDSQFGEVADPRSGDTLSWSECVSEVEEGAESHELGSCCQDEDGPLQTCMKWWVVDKGGVPIGDQYLLEIIMRLFKSKDLPLAVMLLLFSVCFPLLKTVLCVRLSLREASERTLRFLTITSKWSMTDVFLVALLITFFKADSFNFRFEAGAGLYYFAAGAVLSSLAVMILERARPGRPRLPPGVE